MKPDLKRLHAHTCSVCDTQNCYCYAHPCPHKWERENSYVCGFCKAGEKPPALKGRAA